MLIKRKEIVKQLYKKLLGAYYKITLKYQGEITSVCTTKKRKQKIDLATQTSKSKQELINYYFSLWVSKYLATRRCRYLKERNLQESDYHTLYWQENVLPQKGQLIRRTSLIFLPLS